jgi:hypothetical protein
MATQPYNVAELLVLIGGIATAISGMAVAIITAWRTGAKVEAANKQTDAKVDGVATEVGKVHALTNDRATKQDEKISALQEEIKGLIALISTADKRSAVLEDRAAIEAEKITTKKRGA